MDEPSAYDPPPGDDDDLDEDEEIVIQFDAEFDADFDADDATGFTPGRWGGIVH